MFRSAFVPQGINVTDVTVTQFVFLCFKKRMKEVEWADM